MNESTIYQLVTGLLLPFAGTVVGCATVFFLQRQMGVRLQKALLGFAAGVMIAAAVWSLLIPAMEMSAAALALSAGIAIQNVPEGAIVSVPLSAAGMRKGKAFLCGAASSVVEPIGALLTILLTSLLTPMLPYLLTFAAGAMIYVVVEELIPEVQAGEHSNIGTIGAALGFALMMVLDVALG